MDANLLGLDLAGLVAITIESVGFKKEGQREAGSKPSRYKKKDDRLCSTTASKGTSDGN